VLLDGALLIALALLAWLWARSARARRRTLRQFERQLQSATSDALGRLGSAVHEGIAQDLTGISLLLRSVTGSTTADAERIDQIRTHVSRVIEHARALARGLPPV
jgi:signal transduction histidine kinase